MSHVSQWFTSRSPWHNFSEFHGGGDKIIFSFILCKSRIQNICTRKIIHHNSHRLPLRETGKEETLCSSWINKSTLKFVLVSEAVQLNEKYNIILIIHYTAHVLSSVVTADSLLRSSLLSWCKNLFPILHYHKPPRRRLKVLPLYAVKLNLLPNNLKYDSNKWDTKTIKRASMCCQLLTWRYEQGYVLPTQHRKPIIWIFPFIFLTLTTCRYKNVSSALLPFWSNTPLHPLIIVSKNILILFTKWILLHLHFFVFYK